MGQGCTFRTVLSGRDRKPQRIAGRPLLQEPVASKAILRISSKLPEIAESVCKARDVGKRITRCSSECAHA